MCLPGGLTEGEFCDQELSRREEQATAVCKKTCATPTCMAIQGEQFNYLKIENKCGVLLTCSSKTKGFKF